MRAEIRTTDHAGRSRALGHQYRARRRRSAAWQRDTGAGRYAERGCALCHGEKGGGGPSGPLVGGGPLNSTDRDPAKLIGNYWPYATTIFDFTRRAMPWQQPKTLTDNEVYALTAYILALNKIIGENDVMNAETLPKVKMPNRDGFISKYPEKH